MKRAEAEKLLGGYATGILTEAERKALFAAALEHQELFDALMDEEALRELLADPEAKAHLIAGLTPAAQSKVIPFWRHPGLLSAAAGLILASVAGLAYLRSPEGPPSAPKSMAEPAPVQAPASPAPQAKAKSLTAPRPVPMPEHLIQEQKEPPPAPPKGDGTLASPAEARASAPARSAAVHPAAAGFAAEAMARERVASDSRRMEARDQMAKKAEAPRPAAAAVMESAAQAPEAKHAKTVGAVSRVLSLAADPTWTLDPLADGRTRVTVITARGVQALLLKRGASGVEVLKLQAGKDPQGPGTRWSSLVRLAPGDVLDLYGMEGAVPDPAQLPETGPVGGFRARIHPAAK